MSRVRTVGGWVLMLGVGVLFAVGLVRISRRADRRAQSTHTKPRSTAVPVVRPAGPERFIGVVVSRAAIDVTSRVDGRLKEVLVRTGQEVKANDRIAIIDDDPIRKDLQLAQATLAAARAGASKASIELDDAQAKSRRRSEVSAELSQEEVATAKTQAKLGGAGLSAAQAAVAEQRARIAKLQETLRYTDIRAPFPGKIATVYATSGAVLSAQAPIVRLVQNQDLCVRFAVPAERAAGLVVGRELRFDVDSVKTALPGRVENIAPEVDPGSQMLYVEASLDMSDAAKALITPGLVARVRLHDASDPNAVHDSARGWREPTQP